MERQYVKENNKSRERLVKLVGDISDRDLKLVIYKEGWTVAAALAHLAFWDERRLALLKYWKKNGIEPSDIVGIDLDTVNDALIPVFLAMPVRKAAELAVNAAEKVDKEIAGLPDTLVQKIEALGDRAALDRSIHRKMHLNEIEALLTDQ